MFSVIIPLFNKETTIAVTLNSVLNQNFDEFEIIIINDGSTDDSLYVVNSFNDKRIRVISQENKGVSNARNHGIRLAKYHYIAFLDADDSWHPEYLIEILNLINKYTTCSAFTTAYRVIGQNRTSHKCEALQEGIIDNFFETRFTHHIMRTSATVVHKQVFDLIGGFPEGMIGGEDDYMWAKFCLDFKIAFSPKVLATYDNRSSTFYMRRGRMDNCIESWLDFYEPDNYYKNEFIAGKAITAGIRYIYGAPQKRSLEIEKRTAYTKLYKDKWKQLYILNRMPYFMLVALKPLLPLYKKNKSWLGRHKASIIKKLALKRLFPYFITTLYHF